MEIRSNSASGASGASVSRVTDRVAQGMPAVQTLAVVNATPSQTVDAVAQAAEVPSMKALDDAISDINSTMKSLSQNLEFAVDPDSNRTVVKVIDQQTKEVVRQLPSKEALEIAKALDRLQGLLINQKA